jgi:tRNA dimethylallyltransferase
MPSPGARRQPTPPPLAVIVGPTASGKTDLSLALAERLPLEILVADSRQVYRGMDIGTAKPDAAARAAVPHHLLDLVDPDASFTVADWVARARKRVPEIWARGRLPMVVGGTGLYVSALVDGYQLGGQAPSPALRGELALEMEQVGLAPLADRLGQLDPKTARRTDLRNPRRVLRALERAIQAGGAAGGPVAKAWPGRLALIGIERPRSVLVARIEARAAGLFTDGLLDEAARLRQAGYGPELPPLGGHGYREAFRVLAGEWDVEQAMAETVRRTRQYAKRQMTWFRHQADVRWLPSPDAAHAAVVAWLDGDAPLETERG